MTSVRALVGMGLPILGVLQGAAGLLPAVWLMILNWASDALDGHFARRGGGGQRSWIGEHDLHIDMLVAAGLLAYLTLAGLIYQWLALLYAGTWLVIFARVGVPRALGMLCQTPVYAWFVGVAVWNSPITGLWIGLSFALLAIITWPKLPRQLLPEFFDGMRRLWRKHSRQGPANGPSVSQRPACPECDVAVSAEASDQRQRLVD